MGRVRNRATTVGPEVEAEIPKKTQLLFPKPQLFKVKGKPDEATVTQVETRREHASLRGNTASNVRLKSLRNVVNNKFLPKFVKYQMSTQPTTREIMDYLTMKEIEGFGRGAIVARRFGVPANWEQPPMWGMILVVNHVHHTPQQPYSPYIVKWLSTNETEGAWAEDLYIIHQAFDDKLVYEWIEAQGGPYTGDEEEV